ncbi:MAG: hypothetical protein IKI83_02830 [Prevotella sp.]|nr:hypothetical protein [Prevotella sp.]
MNRIKLFFMAVVLLVCNTVEAQFVNADKSGKVKNVSSSTFDGNGPERGYKGFIEGGYTVGVGDYKSGRAELITTHGYQFNNYIFAGVGAGAKYYTDDELWAFPIYADVRANILNHSISPFVDLKIGYAAGDVDGFLLIPSIGCRYGFNNNTAITASIGYEIQKAKLYASYYYGGRVYESSSRETIGGLAFKIGFEF